MKKLSTHQTLVIGFTLFSMFFGAGNLIFPPLLGAQAGTALIPSMAGLLITAVCFPILGVVAIAKHDNMMTLAGYIHPLFASALTILICLLIGPFVAIPRTASTSFEMAVVPFIGKEMGETLWVRFLYSAIFFLAASIVAIRPGKLKNLLGRIMTPTLVLLIAIFFIGAVAKLPVHISAPIEAYKAMPIWTGFITGYQTMDILAALQFGIIIAMNIEDFGVHDKKIIAKETMKAGVIAGALLAIIYSATSWIGSACSGIPGLVTDTETGAGILSYAIGTCFGSIGQIVAGLTFFVACFDVCCGLLSSCSKYFNTIIPKVSYKAWLVIFAVFSFVVSSAGLYSILSFSFPILKVLCPVAILLTVFGLLKRNNEIFKK